MLIGVLLHNITFTKIKLMKKILLFLMMSLLLLQFQTLIAQTSTLYLTTTGGSYSTEKWVDITTGSDGTGAVIWAQGDGTYGNGAGLVTDQVFTVTDGVTYYINCYDKYDDSWDGTTYEIRNASGGGGELVANNGGASPDDNNDEDSSSSFEDPDLERESSEAFSFTPPACSAPGNGMASSVTLNSASLSWTTGGASA